MEVGKLTVNARTTTGKGAARQLRAKGLVPGVCYGASPDGKIAPLPIVVEVKALRAALDPVRKHNTLLDLTIVDEKTGQLRLTALLREFQIDPIRRDVTHVDLYAIDPNKPVVAEVPLEFVGKPKGAIDGGQIRIALRELSLKAKPAELPVKITVDVSPLEIGDVLHVSDLTLPAGVLSMIGMHQAVVSCAPPEAEEVVTPVVAEGAAVPGAEGAAPAAGAKGAPAAPAKKK